MFIQSHRSSRIPRATFRLQFHEHFRLTDGIALVPYLEKLGISHLYASPSVLARAHSPHGYDVCDPNQLNPELGTEDEFMKLVTDLRERDMGLMLDIVPNHMGIWTPENRWWWDVLTNGPGSPYAEYFDIDWQAPDPELRGKVLAPVLADRYERVLQRGELRVERLGDGFVFRHHEHWLPVTPPSLPEGLISEDEAENKETIGDWLRGLDTDRGALDALVRQQYYMPACWREADTRLNYRRFFAVATLAGVRVEEEHVFKDTHSLVRRWLRHGWVDGLRVDHPDGLRDPGQYLQRLREAAPAAWIVVEKILEPEETLPGSWPVAGTTGYDFLNALNGLFVDAGGEKPLTDFYREFTDETVDYAALAREKKRLVVGSLFAAEVNRLSGLLARIAARHLTLNQFTLNKLRDAMCELAASLPVYRTYIRPEEGAVSKADAGWIERAEVAARRLRPELDPKLFDLLRNVLSLKLRGELEDEFVARFQQLTGPVMAKGVEDAALYCFNRLASLNEVGGDPGKFGVTLHEFHEFCGRQQSRRPNAMLTTSTHDTKRSEDVRARINLLSEIPGPWAETVRRWSKLNERHRVNEMPDRNMEYLLYETLVGASPLSVERAQAYMEKAACEAGQHTAWSQRNPAYDGALRAFVAGILGDAAFVKDLNSFLASLADAGYTNSLAQTLLKLTAPGVPDVYQGCELWDLSLVDPDNRRPVDFELHRRLLDEAETLTAEEIWQRRETGLPKLWLTRKVLTFRREHPGLFDGSSRHDTLLTSGAKTDHVIAFLRGSGAVSIAPRLTLKLNNDWADTALELPPGDWRNELTGEDLPPEAVLIAAVFRKFPVALLARKDHG